MPVYKDSRGRWRWRVFRGGRRYSGSTPVAHNTKRAAEQLERAALDQLISGQRLGGVPLVRDFAQRFLEHQAPRTKPLTRIQQKYTVDVHIVPQLGHLRVDQVGKEQVDRVITAWCETLSPKSVNARLGTLRRMLSVAAEWGVIARVPRFQFLKLAKETPRFLSDDEAARLLAAAEPNWRSMMLIGLRTGLRPGELRALRWIDVDFPRRRLHVRQTDPGRNLMEPTTTKGNAARFVPLTRDATATLLDLRTAAPDALLVWPAPRWRSRRHERARSEKGMWHAMERATDAAGIADATWHTLRHTFASWLVMRGVPIRVVQEYLGHSSIVMTEKYSHLAPDLSHVAVELLDTPLGPEWQRGANALPPGPDKSNDSGPTPDRSPTRSRSPRRSPGRPRKPPRSKRKARRRAR